jgi:hypothetical protein
MAVLGYETKGRRIYCEASSANRERGFKLQIQSRVMVSFHRSLRRPAVLPMVVLGDGGGRPGELRNTACSYDWPQNTKDTQTIGRSSGPSEP